MFLQTLLSRHFRLSSSPTPSTKASSEPASGCVGVYEIPIVGKFVRETETQDSRRSPLSRRAEKEEDKDSKESNRSRLILWNVRVPISVLCFIVVFFFPPPLAPGSLYNVGGLVT